MHSLDPGIPGRWRGAVARLFACLAVAAIAGSVIAAEPLFPQPLHLTRIIEDPIAGTSITVEEYCAGDQVVSVAGDRVTIVDYAKQEMTEIDRAAGTWSLARFDEIAKAMSAGAAPSHGRKLAPTAEGRAQAEWASRPLPARASARGRTLNAFELTPPQEGVEGVRLEVAVDPSVRLSRSAVEALIGASFPHPRREEHEAILRAAGSGDSGPLRVKGDSLAAATFGLPIEQTLSVEFEGRTLTLKNTVRDVKSELPPESLRRIPPGARQVEPRAVLMMRETLALDSPPAIPSDRP